MTSLTSHVGRDRHPYALHPVVAHPLIIPSLLIGLGVAGGVGGPARQYVVTDLSFPIVSPASPHMLADRPP